MYLPFAQFNNEPTGKKLPLLCSFPFAQSNNELTKKNYNSYAPSLLRSPKMS